jgi:TonB family protein
LTDFLFKRPIKVVARPGAPFTRASFGSGFWSNLADYFGSHPPLPKRASASAFGANWDAGFGTFGRRLKELFFPRKLAPLQVTSKPVQVKDIWSKDKNFGWTQIASIAFHGGLVILLTVPILTQVKPAAPQTTATNLTPVDISPYMPLLPKGASKAGGGGGGGTREQLPPTKGRVPKFSWTQFTPPMAVVRNQNPKLPMKPTLLGPPELKVASPPLSNYGDPLQASVNLSGGPGGGGGIGTGCCGGIGSGSGAGLGPGSGGGTGGGVFEAGVNGVGYPSCPYRPSPEYSDEARKAKYQGSVALRAIITVDGRVADATPVQGPGMGLEEKAVEGVRQWHCIPARGPNGKPVPTWVTIEVNFHLY